MSKEIRRRTKVVGIFPNSQFSDDWITGAAYLDMSV